MADGMLGEQVLPEEVQSRRRKVRRRLNQLREPIRSRRQDVVPGPDIIGTAEQNIMNLRSRLTGGSGILPSMRGSDGSSGDSQTSTDKREKTSNSINT